MKRAEQNIIIASSPARVWKVLTDFPAYGLWNVFITRVTGEVAPGAAVELRVQLPGVRVSAYPVDVSAMEPEKLLRLKWSAPVKAEHVMSIEPLPDGGCRFSQRMELGLLAGITADGDLLAQLNEMFGHMNRALKARCEESAE